MTWLRKYLLRKAASRLSKQAHRANRQQIRETTIAMRRHLKLPV